MTTNSQDLNLFLLTRKNWIGDQYVECVVAAESEKEALRVHPNGDLMWDESFECWVDELRRVEESDEWFRDDVEVKLIGVAQKGLPKGLVTSSFLHA